MAMIEIKNISKWYGNFQVLKDCSVDVEKGEVVVVCGPSGSGKSTLIKTVNALEPFQKGEIIVDGISVGDPKTNLPQLRSRVGMVFQHFELFPHLSIRENLVLAQMKVLGRGREEATERGLKLLDRVGLLKHADKFPGQMSGGQQQRVAIARALATDPKVLLCDEATSALDPKTTRQILELIRDINQKLNITVVIITHQMSVVKEVCSHVAILDDGCVAESGMVGTVFAAPKSEAGRRLVFPGGADAQVYNPQDEKLVRLVFKDSKTTSIPLIARLAAEEGVFCNVISASTQKLSETVYGSMMLGIPSTQYDKAVAFIHNVANVQVEEVDHHVQ